MRPSENQERTESNDALREQAGPAFILASLGSRFRVLGTLALFNILSCASPNGAPKAEEPTVDPVTIIQETQTQDQIRLGLETKYPILKTSKRPYLWTTESFTKEINRELKGLNGKKGADDYRAQLNAMISPEALAQMESLHEDPAFIAFVERASYEEFRLTGAILKSDSFEREQYFDTDHLWQTKLRSIDGVLQRLRAEHAKTKGKAAKEKKAKSVIRQQEEMDVSLEIQKDMAGRQIEKIPYQDLHKRVSQTIEALQPHLAELGLDNPYFQYIDADTMMAIAIHETMPREYQPLAKIHVFRALLEKGWEVEYMPSIHDTIASYGMYQNTLRTHNLARDMFDEKLAEIEGLSEDYRSIGAFEDATTVEKQTMVAYLNSANDFNNFYIAALRDNPEFAKCFEQSSEMERKIFFSGVSGYIHNHGWGSKLRDRMEEILEDKKDSIFDPENPEANLYGAYQKFAQRIGSLAGDKKQVAARHLRGTGDLTTEVVAYSAVDKKVVSKAVAQAVQQQPEVVAELTPVAKKEAVQTPTRDISESKLNVKNGNFVFTIPNWQLQRVLTALIKDPSRLEEIRKMNGGGRFEVGKLILIPVSDMQPVFQENDFITIEVSDAKDADKLLGEILRDENKTPANKDAIFLLTNSKGDDWDDITDHIRVPRAWLKEDWIGKSKKTEVAQQTVLKAALQTETARVALFSDTTLLFARATSDGLVLEGGKPQHEKNYAGVKAAGVTVPLVGDGYSIREKAGEPLVMPGVEKTLTEFAAEFKRLTEGYGVVIFDLLESPELRVNGLYFTGRSFNVSTVRFTGPDGQELDRDKQTSNIDALRAILLGLIEQYQFRGLMLGMQEEKRDYVQVYVPKSNRGPVGPVMK